MGESIAMMVFIVVGDIFSFPFILIISLDIPTQAFGFVRCFFSRLYDGRGLICCHLANKTRHWCSQLNKCHLMARPLICDLIINSYCWSPTSEVGNKLHDYLTQLQISLAEQICRCSTEKQVAIPLLGNKNHSTGVTLVWDADSLRFPLSRLLLLVFMLYMKSIDTSTSQSSPPVSTF